ncbi:MAG: SufE family protein [Chitinophagales bacterium]|nr:SufE family protein [Chitinophagales bacterium]
MLSAAEQSLVEEMDLFDDPMDKYEHIIELGKELPALDEQYKTEERLVKGCQSKVWLHSFEKNGKIYYEADSNTVITKGIIAMLIRVLSGLEAAEIVNHPLAFINAVQLHEHLSSQRSNGLTAMIKQMKDFAKIYA